MNSGIYNIYIAALNNKPIEIEIWEEVSPFPENWYDYSWICLKYED